MLITMCNKNFLAKKKYTSDRKDYFAGLYLSVIIELLELVDNVVYKMLKL